MRPSCCSSLWCCRFFRKKGFMLRRVDSDCFLSSSVHHYRVSISLSNSLVGGASLKTRQGPVELKSMAPPQPHVESHAPSHPVASLPDSKHIVPPLVDGTPLNSDQRTTFQKLLHMVETTLHTKKSQSHSKDEKTVLGAEIAHQYPSFFSPECLRRYLVSRQFCEKKAYDMMMGTVHWRSTNVPKTYQHRLFEDCLKSRFMEWHGFDASGRPTLYMKSANANLELPRETRLDFCVVTLEKGISLMEPSFSGHVGVEQWNIVVDETDRGAKHTDNRFLSHLAPMLTSHYAQRLHRCYIVNPGLITKLVYGVVKIFLDEGTTSKIRMVHAKHDKKQPGVRIVKELIADLGPASVPVAYGGTLEPRLLNEYCAFFESIPMQKC